MLQHSNKTKIDNLIVLLEISHPHLQETSLTHCTTAMLKFKDKSLEYNKRLNV